MCFLKFKLVFYFLQEWLVRPSTTSIVNGFPLTLGGFRALGEFYLLDPVDPTDKKNNINFFFIIFIKRRMWERKKKDTHWSEIGSTSTNSLLIFKHTFKLLVVGLAVLRRLSSIVSTFHFLFHSLHWNKCWH